MFLNYFTPIGIIMLILRQNYTMKPVRFVIPKTSGTSFRVQYDRGSHFYDTIHYHPEYQITLIVKGDGTRFIGNSVERFKAGDVYLIGKNVPHVFRSDTRYYEPGTLLESYGISFFVNTETLGEHFFDLPEMAPIKRLLELGAHGLVFKNEDRRALIHGIMKIPQFEDFARFQHILSLLNSMAHAQDMFTLSSVPFVEPSSDAEHERINVVFQYLSTHFTQEISLDTIANVASMTTNSFCRYFKKRTGKPFSNFLNDMRIEYACHLIAGSMRSYGEVAMECGYNNLSYFNRQFKLIMGLTPRQYRNKYGLEASK